ncbi:acyl-CoA dehydrogenase [Streptomyces sp. NPDC001401]|uniref:acyl-CoA dehydrogenase family protein n=1 Tax=Streptomyces sp. NPDC001401 TaxID=3364570 RepID=UPI0036D14065
MPPLATLSAAAHDELRQLVHGPCDSAFLAALQKALDTRPPSDAPRELLLYRLRALGESLPPARRLFDDPAQLAALNAWAAVADPCLSMTTLVHHLLCLGSLTQLSEDPERLEAHLAALEAGRIKGAYLITEVGQANSHLATRTRAEFDPAGGCFVLHTPDPAAAKFSSCGTPGIAHTGVVLARLTVGGADRGVFAFLADLADDRGPLPGVEVSSRLGLSALPLDYVLVRFDRLRVPYAHWLSDGARIDGDGVLHDPAGSPDLRLQRTLRVGQGLWATVPAVAAATSRQAAVLAVEYSRHRRTQGRLAPGTPLLGYRTQQRVVLGALADAFALTCAAHQARTLWTASLTTPTATHGRGAGDASAFSPWTAVHQTLAMYKAATVRTAARITDDCVSRCGFSGHLDVNRMTKYHGFHQAFDTAGGDSRLIFYDVGRSLVEQRHAPTPSAPADAPPTSPHWWPAIAGRHQDLLTERLRRLRDARGTDGADQLTVWNPLLEDAGLLGEFHGARLIAEDVSRILTQTKDRVLLAVLEPLAALHGVLTARRWSASLLALGTLQSSDIEALSDAADRLCDAIMPHLPFLTEAFAYPADVGGAPLAAADYPAALGDTLTWTRGGAA